jgi:hypothetical protein
VDASLTGLGQHKFKSINVEANLLDSWLVQRGDLEAKIRHRVIFLFAICSFSAIVIPLSASLQRSIAVDGRKAKSELVRVNQDRVKLQEQATSLAPSIQFDSMSASCRRNAKLTLKQLTKVINAAPLDVVFSSFKLDVLGGDCTIRLTADATNSEIGRQFVDIAGKGKNVTDSMQTAIRRSNLFAESGVTFDYIKRVRFEE